MIVTRHCVVLLAAVVLLVVIQSELSAVVAATDQPGPAASVTIVSSPVRGAVTVSLADITGTLWGAAPPALVVPSAALLPRRRLQPDSSCCWS